MVFYFSGTGNSLYLAKNIADKLQEELISIADMVCQEQYQFQLKKEETIGFVYPVHGFAPPDVVTNFIKKVKFDHYSNNYCYSVYNCAGCAEYTNRIMKETCESHGIPLSGFFEVLMPGNYIIGKRNMPENTVKEYLEGAQHKIQQIVEQINERTSNYQKEKHSFLRSYGIHKLLGLEKYSKFVFGPECVGCGKCSQICPMQAIKLKDGHPIRNHNNCVFCLACVNVCPTHALQIGKKTVGHLQYIHPEYNGKARDVK